MSFAQILVLRQAPARLPRRERGDRGGWVAAGASVKPALVGSAVDVVRGRMRTPLENREFEFLTVTLATDGEAG